MEFRRRASAFRGLRQCADLALRVCVNLSLYGTIGFAILLSSMPKKPHTPTREEIAILTAQIRATWTEAETRMRIAKVTGLVPTPDRSKPPSRESDDVPFGDERHDDSLNA